MTAIYVAGKFEAQERLRRVRDAIHAAKLGDVVGTWLDEESAPGEITPEQKREYANRDEAEVAAADLLILDTFDENNRGGREVEYGMARAWGLETWIVGPKRNVFHEQTDAHFAHWGAAIDELRGRVEEAA